MDLSFVQGAWALVVTATIIGSYLLGKTAGASEERARIVARKRNTDKTRRAS